MFMLTSVLEAIKVLVFGEFAVLIKQARLLFWK